MKRNTIDKSTILLSLTIVFAFVWIYFPIIITASENIRIIDAFNSDEVDFLHSMLNAFHNNNFKIGHYEYGLLYYNIGLCFFYLTDLFIPLNEQVAVIIMRVLSSLFLIGTALTMRKFAKFCFGFGENLVFIIVLLGSITLIKYSVMLHPDMAQVFCVAVSLLCLSKYYIKPSIKLFILSSAFAGFAFSTKYVGVALLPILWVIYVIKQPLIFNVLKNKIKSSLLMILTLVIAFFANPNFYKKWLTPNNEITDSILAIISGGRILAFVLLGLAIFLFFVKSSNRYLERIQNGSSLSIISLGIFVSAFGIGSPQGLLNFNFLNGIVAVASVHKDGHWFRDDSGLIGWLDVLLQFEVFNWVWSLFAIVGIAYTVWTFFSGFKKDLYVTRIFPLLWIFTFCFVIVFRVKSHFAHFLIPIIPFCAFYAAIGMQSVTQFLVRNSIKNKKIAYSISIILVLITGSLSIIMSLNYSKSRVEGYANAPELKAGKWLEKNIKESVFISCDKYTYIPKNKNLNYRQYWGLSLKILENDAPNYLVINYHTFQWFLDANDVTTYLHGKDLFLERNRLYNSLIDDKQKDFKLVADFNTVKVYKKRPPNGSLSK